MTQDLHTLTGPYALHALDPAEAKSFEEHLDSCAACRKELREFRETAALLGDASAVTPSPTLKQDVLSQIAVTRQESPRIVRLATPDVTSRVRRFALPAAAAVAAIALGLSLALGNLSGRVNELEGRERTLSALLAASDVTLAHGSGAGATAALVASPSRGEALVTFTGLEAPPAGHIYELWMIGDAGPTPAGLVSPDALGQAIAVMSGDLAASHTIAVTVEPAGGSEQPTTLPFLRLDLRS